jgi:hypothetical protein
MTRMTHTLRNTMVFSLFGLGCGVACESEGGGTSPKSDVQDPASDRSAAQLNEDRLQQMEELRAVGYVSWDSGADETQKGVTWLRPERVAPGYNLYTNQGTQVYLTDLDGKRVHTWNLPAEKKSCEHAELLENGKIAALFNRRSLTVVDWDSTVVLDVKMKFHHDVAVLPDGGGFLVPLGRMETYRGRRVKFDSLVRLSVNGEVQAEWSTFARLSELQPLHTPSPLDLPREPGKGRTENDYYHLNSIEILPDTPLGQRDARFRAGNLLTCFRNANLILVLDSTQMAVLWHWGTETLDLPHMPTMLANGNILVFDNGTHRGFSRVVEIDPPSGSIVWEYRGDPPESFFSKWRGSSQRLANGNTLICESERGYVFEVAPDGQKVWEFWNPDLRKNKRKRIYRFMRLLPSRVEPLLEELDRRE